MPIGGRQSNLDLGQKGPDLPQCPREWQWACRNGECIARYDTCDGITQCSDGSDEWNCDDWDRMKQDHGFQHGEGATQPKPVITTTTTLAPDSSYVVLSTRQIYFTFLVFILLSLALIWVIRRRARQRALMRNRRGNILSPRDDSDEDDVLISSMYS